MSFIKQLFILTTLTIMSVFVQAQQASSLAEKLGYDADAKLLIVHADDLGLSHSVNTAAIKAYKNNGITSGSVMVPCPWFEEIAVWLKDHPEYDIGVHLTLTAEWKKYHWDGVMPSSEIPSLLNEAGYFYPTVEQVAAHVNPVEAEKELRAQIDRALAFGIKPSHIDTHMGSVAATPELLQIYLKLGMEYQIPLFMPRGMIYDQEPEQIEMIESMFVLVDHFFMLPDEAVDMKWNEVYKQIIEDVKPGLNQIIIHPSIDNAEMQAISVDHPAYGSAWRQRDLDYFLSQEYRDLLAENNIRLVRWGDIKNIMSDETK